MQLPPPPAPAPVAATAARPTAARPAEARPAEARPARPAEAIRYDLHHPEDQKEIIRRHLISKSIKDIAEIKKSLEEVSDGESRLEQYKHLVQSHIPDENSLKLPQTLIRDQTPELKSYYTQAALISNTNILIGLRNTLTHDISLIPKATNATVDRINKYIDDNNTKLIAITLAMLKHDPSKLTYEKYLPYAIRKSSPAKFLIVLKGQSPPVFTLGINSVRRVAKQQTPVQATVTLDPCILRTSINDPDFSTKLQQLIYRQITAPKTVRNATVLPDKTRYESSRTSHQAKIQDFLTTLAATNPWNIPPEISKRITQHMLLESEITAWEQSYYNYLFYQLESTKNPHDALTRFFIDVTKLQETRKSHNQSILDSLNQNDDAGYNLWNRRQECTFPDVKNGRDLLKRYQPRQLAKTIANIGTDISNATEALTELPKSLTTI